MWTTPSPGTVWIENKLEVWFLNGSSSHNCQDSEIAVGIRIHGVEYDRFYGDTQGLGSGADLPMERLRAEYCSTTVQCSPTHFPTNCASEHHTANEQLCCGNESCPSSIRSACLPSDDQYRDTAGILCRFGDAKACDLGEAHLILSA
jgi:hypothetical protein